MRQRTEHRHSTMSDVAVMAVSLVVCHCCCLCCCVSVSSMSSVGLMYRGDHPSSGSHSTSKTSDNQWYVTEAMAQTQTRVRDPHHCHCCDCGCCCVCHSQQSGQPSTYRRHSDTAQHGNCCDTAESGKRQYSNESYGDSITLDDSTSAQITISELTVGAFYQPR